MKLAYTGFDRAGKPVRGHIDAPDAHDAGEQLRVQGIFATSIITAHNATGLAAIEPGGVRLAGVARLETVAFTMRQLGLLLTTGTQVLEALTALERQQKDPDYRAVLTSLRTKVEEGKSLSEAMGSHPGWFDPVVRSLVAAGEGSGQLPTLLDRLHMLLSQQARLRKSVAQAMVYPLLLVVFSLAVVGAMVGFVLPRFHSLFDSLKAPLPGVTRWLMAFAHLVREHWPWLLAGAAALIVAGAWWLSSSAGRRCVDRVVVRLPRIGPLARAIASARIARVLATLVEGRVPLLEALALSRHCVANSMYVELMQKAEESVLRGEQLSATFSSTSLIPPSLIEALRSGERSGQIAPVLANVADYLEEDAQATLKTLTSLVEPVILVTLGLVVGAIAVSMMLPLFDLTAAAGGPAPGGTP